MKFSARVIKKDGETILTPLYSSDAEQMQKLKQETDYFIEVKANRNHLFHAKGMALLRLGHDNQEKYDNFDHYRKVVIMNAGFYDTIDTNSGEIYIPKSLSFEKMDEVEFQEVYERVLDVIAKQLDTAPEEIRNNLTLFM